MRLVNWNTERAIHNYEWAKEEYKGIKIFGIPYKGKWIAIVLVDERYDLAKCPDAHIQPEWKDRVELTYEQLTEIKCS
jgi:hypothetical protein